MNAENINTISTAVIAFITVLATMAGLYYDLKSNTTIWMILIFEIIFLISVCLFIFWVNGKIKNRKYELQNNLKDLKRW